MRNNNNKSQFFSTKEETIKWIDENHIQNYTINDDLSVDVNNRVEISWRNLKFIPINFNSVTGDFGCRYNQLISLAGSPKNVTGDFWCQNNKLITLVGAPETVGRDFACDGNKLISLIEIIDCDFKEKIYFNIDEKNFKQKELIPILKKYYNNKYHHYILAENEFHDIIKPILQKRILKQKLTKNGNSVKSKGFLFNSFF